MAGFVVGCACAKPPPPKFFGRVCTTVASEHRQWVLACVAGHGDDSTWVEACAYQAEGLFCPLSCFQYETYEKIPCDNKEWQAVLKAE